MMNNANFISKISELKIMASGGLGDCLLLSPFLRHFRNSGLYDRIVCAAPAKAVELFDMNPNIDQVIPCSGRDLYLWGMPEKFCRVFSPYLKITGPDQLGSNMNIKAIPLHSFNQSEKNVVKQLADYHGIDLKNDYLEIFTSDQDEHFADEVIRTIKNKPLVLINTTSTNKQKEYPASHWQEVVDRLSDYVTVVELAPKDSQLLGTQIITPMPNLRASAAVFKRVSCVITIDSFAHHLACAVGTRALVLFGPSNPLAFGHKINTNIRMTKCSPCADTIRRKECKQSFCMEGIPPEAIVDRALRLCRFNQVEKD